MGRLRLTSGFLRAAHRLALADRKAVGVGDAELFLLAHGVGVPGALERGRGMLSRRAARIEDDELRRSFLQDVPAHARLIDLATRGSD